MPTDITDWNDLAAIPANATGTYIQQNDIDDTSAGYATHASEWDGISIGQGGEYNGNGYSIAEWSTSTVDTAAFFTKIAGYVHDLRMARVLDHASDAPGRAAIFVDEVTSNGHVYKCHVERFARLELDSFGNAGFVIENDGLIEDCICEADVVNEDRDAIGFGPIFGSGTLRRCVSMPTNLESQGFGQIYAFSSDSGPTYTNCHYSTQETTTDASGATGHPQSDLESFDAETTLSNFDFNTVWEVDINDPPALRDPAPPTTTIDLQATGSGTGNGTARLLFPPTDLKATGNATGTATASVVRRRNTTASGAGAGTATASVPIRERLLSAVGSGTGVATAQMEAITPFTDLRATGSASGNGTAREPVRVRSLDAEGNGTGEAQAAVTRRRGLSADGAGSGAGAATMFRVRPLTATGAGVGDGSASFVLVREGSGVISTPQNGVTVLTDPNVVELLSPAYNTVLPTDTIQDNQ